MRFYSIEAECQEELYLAEHWHEAHVKEGGAGWVHIAEMTIGNITTVLKVWLLLQSQVLNCMAHICIPPLDTVYLEVGQRPVSNDEYAYAIATTAICIDFYRKHIEHTSTDAQRQEDKH